MKLHKPLEESRSERRSGPGVTGWYFCPSCGRVVEAREVYASLDRPDVWRHDWHDEAAEPVSVIRSESQVAP